ncbi:MAG: aminotransferase class III-fold pyridoxal phosphate-dependent enzyme, partial [Pseudomonadota bacterium]
MAVARGVGSMHQRFAVRGENAEIYDVEGNRYIDFATGIAVCNTGHSDPRIVEAVNEQLSTFSHVCFQVTPYEAYVAFAEKLNDVAPGPSPKKTLFLSTGSEAVENAVKIARAYTGRRGVVAFRGGYHGRTLMTMALTGKVAPYKARFGPMPAEVFHAQYPFEYHGISEDDAFESRL